MEIVFTFFNPSLPVRKKAGDFNGTLHLLQQASDHKAHSEDKTKQWWCKMELIGDCRGLSPAGN